MFFYLQTKPKDMNEQSNGKQPELSVPEIFKSFKREDLLSTFNAKCFYHNAVIDTVSSDSKIKNGFASAKVWLMFQLLPLSMRLF